MGPLAGMKIVEIGSIGPGPFCAQMLADMGADVLRIDRKNGQTFLMPARFSLMHRSRRSIAVDLKCPEGVKVALKLVGQADALIEGFRPGVMERMGLGPKECMEVNPQLVYGRVTGWGQQGPLAHAAGHDINFIALAGALHAIGRKGEKPVPPLNLVGDFGGGGMLLAFGVMCGVYEARQSGLGQVVDAAMVDGVAAMMSSIYGLNAAGGWSTERGTNFLDGASHFYNTYETADGKWITVGAFEAEFYSLLINLTGVDVEEFRPQMDSDRWSEWEQILTKVFLQKTRDEWCTLMEGTDVCFAPVLNIEEATEHPHNVYRGTFVEVDGVIQPAPAPRFSRTKPEIQSPPPEVGQHTESALGDWGFSSDDVAHLKQMNVI